MSGGAQMGPTLRKDDIPTSPTFSTYSFRRPSHGASDDDEPTSPRLGMKKKSSQIFGNSWASRSKASLSQDEADHSGQDVPPMPPLPGQRSAQGPYVATGGPSINGPLEIAEKDTARRAKSGKWLFQRSIKGVPEAEKDKEKINRKAKRPAVPTLGSNESGTSTSDDYAGPLSAPIVSDRRDIATTAVRDMGNPSSAFRNRSTDSRNLRNHGHPRNMSDVEAEAAGVPLPKGDDEMSIASKDNRMLSSSYKEGNPSTFFSTLKASSSKAAEGIGKAGKGIFSKLTRSGPGYDIESSPITPLYNEQFLNLKMSLEEQTRRSRIWPDLNGARDKSEFWLPAIAYRCIDYLNDKTKIEGLYRIPGGTAQVKHWQKRFNDETDINLFNEEIDDVHTIASLLKAWLRDLPEEIFPKKSQIAFAEHPDTKAKNWDEYGKEVPEVLIDEICNLPPYNFYLLFALTCHLSMLHHYSNINKMNFQNICVCIQQSLRIDYIPFAIMVCNWTNVWKCCGCFTEREYRDKEYRILGLPIPPPKTAEEKEADIRPLNKTGTKELQEKHLDLNALELAKAEKKRRSRQARQARMAAEKAQPNQPDQAASRRSSSQSTITPIRSRPHSMHLPATQPWPETPSTPRNGRAAKLTENGIHNGHLETSIKGSQAPLLSPVAPLSPMQL